MRSNSEACHAVKTSRHSFPEVRLDKIVETCGSIPAARYRPRPLWSSRRSLGLGDGDGVQVTTQKKLSIRAQLDPVLSGRDISEMKAAGGCAPRRLLIKLKFPQKTSESIGMTKPKMLLNSPVKIAIKSRIIPYCSSASMADSKLDGNTLLNILLPSSGGIGNKLKMASPTFKVKNPDSKVTAP